jgi:hypothetical protein
MLRSYKNINRGLYRFNLKSFFPIVPLSLSMPEAIAHIANYNVTQAELEAGQQQLMEVIALHPEVLNAKAEAQCLPLFQNFYKLLFA